MASMAMLSNQRRKILQWIDLALGSQAMNTANVTKAAVLGCHEKNMVLQDNLPRMVILW
jgi:hypothetical protein